MLTIKVQKELKAAEKYMEEHLITGGQTSEGELRAPAGDLNPAQERLENPLAEYFDDPQMKWGGKLVSHLKINKEGTSSV